MRRAAILIICSFFLLISAEVSAQTFDIDAMQISIWPEYDRPEVLIIYHVTLAESTSLPANITLRIPAECGGPYNLAYVDIQENGETALYNLDYETQLQGDWLEISFSTPTSSIQMEYYDPAMQRTGDSREFLFTWMADYSVRSMAIQVRQPVNATNMQIEPDLGASSVFQDEQIYYSALFGQVKAGEQFDVRLRYDKPDTILAEGYDQVFADNDGTVTQQTTFENTLPWVVGGLGILLITIAVVWYLMPNQENPRLHKRHAVSNDEKQPENSPLYCHNCGARNNAEDQFCRSCGTKLRK